MATRKKLALWSLGLAFAAASLSFTGCETDRTDRVISSQEFIAPTLQSMRTLTTKLEILRAMRPGDLDSDLLDVLTRARPLGKVSDDDLLVYETVSGTIVGLDMCPECTENAGRRSAVTLYWTQEEMENEFLNTWGVLALDPAISFDTPGDPTSPGVQPIELQGETFRGWMLAYEPSSGSIIGFKKDPTYRPVPIDAECEEADENRKECWNFGAGNGLILAVVASGNDLAAQLQQDRPRVSRLFELEDGKILVFFTSGISAVHLLDLEMATADVDADLRDTANREQPELTDEIMVPRGTLRTDIPGQAFVTYDFIKNSVTRNSEIDLDDFQPLFVPSDSSSFCEGGPLPRGGSALVFDSGSSNFLEIFEIPDPGNPTGGLGGVRLALSTASIQNALDSSPPFFMSQGVYGTSCSSTLIFEETSNNLFAYEFLAADPGKRLKVAADSVKFLLRREPVVRSGDEVVPGGDETVLTASRNSIRENRLFFDQGRDQLLAIHFGNASVAPSYNVVISADRQDFEAITGRPLANLTWIEALPASTRDRAVLRAFDSESTSFLEIRLKYQALPVVDRTR